MTLFILAAGMGSRYGGLKQVDPFTPHGEFIIDFSVYDAIQAGFDRVVFIIKEENYDIFKTTIGNRIQDKIKVEYVFQKLDTLVGAESIPEGRVKPWGTTHALLCAESVLNDSFAVINADDFYGRDAFMKVAEFLKESEGKSEYCMIGYKVANTLTDNGSVSRGVCKSDNGFLTSIIERTKIFKTDTGARFEESDGSSGELGPDTVVSMNFWGFNHSVFEGLKKDFEEFKKHVSDNPLKCEALLPNSIGKMIDNNECSVKVLTTSSKWFGVTYPEDKPVTIEKIQNLVKAGEYPDGLWK